MDERKKRNFVDGVDDLNYNKRFGLRLHRMLERPCEGDMMGWWWMCTERTDGVFLYFYKKLDSQSTVLVFSYYFYCLFSSIFQHYNVYRVLERRSDIKGWSESLQLTFKMTVKRHHDIHLEWFEFGKKELGREQT